MSLDHNSKLIKNAINLRNNLIPQERHLWYDYLSKCPIRFQRQKVIDNCIVDFYCAKAKLVIELDGSQHYTDDEKEKDDLRTNTLEKFGLHVLRISNYDLDRNFHGVCAEIDKIVKVRLKR